MTDEIKSLIINPVEFDVALSAINIATLEDNENLELLLKNIDKTTTSNEYHQVANNTGIRQYTFKFYESLIEIIGSYCRNYANTLWFIEHDLEEVLKRECSSSKEFPDGSKIFLAESAGFYGVYRKKGKTIEEIYEAKVPKRRYQYSEEELGECIIRSGSELNIMGDEISCWDIPNRNNVHLYGFIHYALTKQSSFNRFLANSRKNFESSGGCYITTACVETMGLPDDSLIMQTARAYRDESMNQKSGGTEMINRYNKIAPFIVAGIKTRPNSEQIFKNIFYDDVLPTISLIIEGKNIEAFCFFKNSFERLRYQYSPNVNFLSSPKKVKP